MQSGDDPEAGRPANVIRIRLERHAEYGDDLIPQHPQRPLDFREKPVDTGGVDALDLSEHADIDAVALSHLDERAQVFGQTGAAEAQTRVEEMAADPGVEADAPGHGRHVDAEFLAQVGHHVDERDLGSEKAVGRLLDQFGGRDARGDDRAVEVGLVEVEQQRSRAVGIGADDDPVRLQEVADRRALAEEFRIAGDIELMLRSGQAPDRGVDPVSGPGGNGALLHDQLVAVQLLRDGTGDFLDLGEVGPSIGSGRGAHAEEDDIGRGHGVLGPCGEPEPAGVQVGGQQFLQARLMNGRRSVRKAGHYVGVFVDRRYRVAHLRETHRRDQPRVACAEDSESHAHGRTSSCCLRPSGGITSLLG